MINVAGDMPILDELRRGIGWFLGQKRVRMDSDRLWKT